MSDKCKHGISLDNPCIQCDDERPIQSTDTPTSKTPRTDADRSLQQSITAIESALSDNARLVHQPNPMFLVEREHVQTVLDAAKKLQHVSAERDALLTTVSDKAASKVIEWEQLDQKLQQVEKERDESIRLANDRHTIIAAKNMQLSQLSADFEKAAEALTYANMYFNITKPPWISFPPDGVKHQYPHQFLKEALSTPSAQSFKKGER